MSRITAYGRGVGTYRRLDGDGMDTEDLLISQEHPHASTPSPATLPKRHHNLVTTLKATHIGKEPSPRYIPHEPVRGAVKAVPNPTPWHPEKPSRADLNASHDHQQGHTLPPSKSVAGPHITVAIDEHGGMHAKKGKQRVGQASSPRVTSAERLHGGQCYTHHEATPPEEEREVEGRSSSGLGAEKLVDQVASLQDQLDVQIKVNGDLKKLLVASVGDDLHHKVESLVRTKAHLATEIGGYTQKMTQDYEHLDNLAIEADKWRSKYTASKMLLENVSHERDSVLGQLSVSRSALRDLLQERNALRDCLLQTHRYLKLIRDSFDPQASRKPPVLVKDCLELAQTNQRLGEAVKFRLLGSMPMLATALDYGIQDGLTPAEANGFQVIAEGDSCVKMQESLSSYKPHYQRFHPQVRYENVTFNCCRKCKGDIHVV